MQHYITPNGKTPLLRGAQLQRLNRLMNTLGMTGQNATQLQDELTNQYIKAWASEYNRLMQQAGSRRRVLFIPQRVRRQLATSSNRDAQSIVVTYNQDLRRELSRFLSRNPEASSAEVRAHVTTWHTSRQRWKNAQISLTIEGTATQMAQNDFLVQNRAALRNVKARISPQTAVCDDCQRLVDMGEVSLQVAQANQFPLHINCVHRWNYEFDRVNLPILENLILRDLSA